ncbi:uncharacterized protein PODANS_7_9310 [Podospora anserina S mat+]|uniref:Podospora anserina S mat+ genomic DNA chromosome 7, supercontig 1 n=1 Tax=Podospora anserina (strain S / ATCC MYA-4624 / DSM 980 / FGSC 10383) TaxID=515849 RepID=B2AX49_PODAN|nr:uncharacterized protein PODANS_7_9310 [Podospora anserina S mat+]CAP68973.1 unnamed protein product [Podospora anserina S mat+]CDP32448.1 Putative protein of unknown function [Podospora anserina S mat+]
MSDDVFRRTGRGGAGNYYSKKDIEDVQKASEASADLEAQADLTKTATTIQQQPAPVPYSRGGRGGAGNFYGAADTAASAKQQSEDAERTKKAVAASIAARQKTGGTGRGGAGNYGAAAIPGADLPTPEDEQRKKLAEEEMEMKVLKEVEDQLGKPPGAYHRPGPEE